MYISTDIYTDTSSSLITTFQELANRDYIYETIEESQPNHKGVISIVVPIAIVVSISVGCCLFIGGPGIYRRLDRKRKERKERKQQKKQEKEERESLLAIALSGGGNVENTHAVNSDGLINPDAEQQKGGIAKPLNAVVYSRNGMLSSQRTSYEYEPLPPYEIVQSNVSEKQSV